MKNSDGQNIKKLSDKKKKKQEKERGRVENKTSKNGKAVRKIGK